MSLEEMKKRSELLQQELQNSKLKVQNSTEQLEAAKAQLNMVIGHLNEVNFQIQLLQKECTDQDKELDNVQTIDKGTQEVA